MKVTGVSTEKSRQISKDISLRDKTAFTEADCDAGCMSYMLIANGNCIVS